MDSYDGDEIERFALEADLPDSSPGADPKATAAKAHQEEIPSQPPSRNVSVSTSKKRWRYSRTDRFGRPINGEISLPDKQMAIQALELRQITVNKLERIIGERKGLLGRLRS